MTSKKLKYGDYCKTLFDELGNRRHVHMIARYQRDSSHGWREVERYTTDAGDSFVIDGKIYFRCSDTLVPMNMDFDSPTCCTCEQVIGEIHILHAVSNNEVLGHGDAPFFRLHKQSYADGTAFYSLQDRCGDFFPRHGNGDPHALAASLRLDARPKGGRFSQYADDLLRYAAILDREPDPIPDPKNNEVILAYLTGPDPLGTNEHKRFPDLRFAITWAMQNVPKDSAGWFIYSFVGNTPLTLYDYRRTI